MTTLSLGQKRDHYGKQAYTLDEGGGEDHCQLDFTLGS